MKTPHENFGPGYRLEAMSRVRSATHQPVDYPATPQPEAGTLSETGPASASNPFASGTRSGEHLRRTLLRRRVLLLAFLTGLNLVALVVARDPGHGFMLWLLAVLSTVAGVAVGFTFQNQNL